MLGDNLSVMQSLEAELRGRVDLVYIDPPFATGTDFGAYRDARGPTLAPFLDAMAPRLELVRRLLRPSGILFAHFDDNAVHEMKLLLDQVFGRAAFRGEIIWQLGTGSKKRSFFSIQHNTLLAYSAGDSWPFHRDAPVAREPFAAGSMRTHFRHVDASGRRFRRRVINGKEYVYYADEGRAVGSVWTDIPSMAASSPILAESTGYPTQKPEKLLERILTTCSDAGALVADFFCGSGTTMAVAEKLGRRWIGCDRGVTAVETARRRLLALPERCSFEILNLVDSS